MKKLKTLLLKASYILVIALIFVLLILVPSLIDNL